MHELIVAPRFVFNNIDCVPGSLLGLKNITLEKMESILLKDKFIEDKIITCKKNRK